jgi:hypothetical protein
MEDRLVNATIGILFFGILLVHFIRTANAWVAAVERIQAPVVILTDEGVDTLDDDELGAEWN